MKALTLKAVRLAAIGALGAVSALGLATGTVQVYVSPTGNDSASGLSAATPVLTISQAVTVVENQRAGNTGIPATINVAAGRYQFTNPIQFNAIDSNLTVQGPGNNGAIISGGVQLTAWSKFIPPNIKRRLAVGVRNLISSVAIPTGNLGVMQRRGGAEPATTSQNQPAELLINGTPMSLARFPASGWATATSVGNDGVSATMNVARRTTATTDAWVQGFWSSDAWETWEPLTSAPGTSQIQVGGLQNGSGLGPITPGARFAIVNSLEDLTQPGQYYIDRTGGRLYFYPIASLVASVAEISQLDGYIYSAYLANNLVFKGLTLQACRGEGVKLYGCTNSGLDTCTVRATQLEGVYMTSGSNNFVKNCIISDTGSCGVLSIEGDVPTLTSGGDLITNNIISNAGRMEQTCRPAIWLRNVGATASANTIVNCAGQGIMFDGCNHMISNNDVSHTCTTMNDVGAIYTGRNLLDRGNIVTMNIIHDNLPVVLPRSGGSQVVGVYLDDFSSGFQVTNNIFYNDQIGILIGGGRSNFVDGNAFDAVATPVWVDARGMSWESSFYANGGGYQTQIAAMSPTELALFKSTYPDFLNMVNAANPALPAGNVVSHAYFPTPGVGVLYMDPNYTTSLVSVPNPQFNGNGIFVSAATGNYALVTGANVSTSLPGTAGAVGIGQVSNRFNLTFIRRYIPFVP